MACGFATQVVHLKEFMMTNSGKALDNEAKNCHQKRLVSGFSPWFFQLNLPSVQEFLSTVSRSMLLEVTALIF
jgi:hypothetical protein